MMTISQPYQDLRNGPNLTSPPFVLVPNSFCTRASQLSYPCLTLFVLMFNSFHIPASHFSYSCLILFILLLNTFRIGPTFFSY